MGELTNFFIYVKDTDVLDFIQTHASSVTPLDDPYRNTVAFLGTSGKIATKGQIYGMDNEVFIGNPEDAPDSAKIVVNSETAKVQVYTKDEVDTQISEVNELIENLDLTDKVGALYYAAEDATMYMFKTLVDKLQWLDEGQPKGSPLILDSTVFEFNSRLYQINITNNNNSNTLYFTNESANAVLSLTPSTKVKSLTDNDWTAFTEDYTISVLYDKNSLGVWEDIVMSQQLVGGRAYELDVFDLISTIASRFRISVVGNSSGIITSFIYNVTLTSMYLQASNFNWQTPYVEGSSYTVGGLLIGGSIKKTLYIKISNADSYSITYSVNIGINTYTSNAYYFDGLDFPSTGSGIYNLDIWLDGGSVSSEHLYYNIICVSKADEFTAQLVAVSNVASNIINYYDNTLFDYAIYNRGISTGNVTVKVYQITHNIPSLITAETLTEVPTSVVNTYLTNIEIESEEADMTLYVQVIYGNEQKINLTIDNSYNFPPTSGAIFYMNPSTRSNTQENREYIINAVNESETPASFYRLTWADGADGWTLDENNRKCLRLPSTTGVDIQYAPLASVGNGKALECTYRVKNVSDYNKPIIYCCDNVNSKTFQGFIIYPTKIIIHSKERNSPSQDNVQSYNFMEEETVNLIISITKNYKTSYGNLCIIYVNGVKKCEFSFSNYDNWEIPNYLHMGSDYADLFIYNMRIYNIAFGHSNAITNYINSLQTLEERIACKALNMSIVDDDYNIDFEKVQTSANYGVIEVLDGGKLPGYGLTKTYTTWCNWEMHYLDHPDWDFIINDGLLTGQGTTSMNYLWWNLRVRTDKSNTKHTPSVTYPNNDTPMSVDETSDVKVNMDGGLHPAVNKITAKKNYASSMQSHKMGANMAFNDLHNEVIGDNEVNGRVGLYQYPFYMFQKIKVEGTESYAYKFIGLYTIGPDKGDTATYGYDNEDTADDLLVLEGVDHDKLLAIFKYPWTDNTVTYNSTAEAISIIKDNDNYEKGWDVTTAGSAKTDEDILQKCISLWKPAYNVAYNNNPFLLPYDTTAETVPHDDAVAWRTLFTEDGHSYQRYEIWSTTTYDHYYYDVNISTYKKSGINMLTDLGLTDVDIAGMDNDEINALFINKRKLRFANTWTTYFHKDDTIFHYVWLYIMGASDNLAKNTYPYILGSYSDGHKWRWRQDDLDTIFDIDNQGHSVKEYSIEPDDWTDSNMTAYVYKGEDSAFWTLIRDTQQVDIKLMGKNILQGMYNLSDTGTSTIDRLYGFFTKYFWKNAQKYFTKTAYNSDAELIYEDAWPLYDNGTYSVDVNPLEQSLGDHYEAERAWVYKRLIFCMSKFQFTPFNDYSDTCLGRITIRTQYQQSFTLTPAIDMYPSILSGQGTILAASDRVKAGNSITFTGAGGTNTNIYIMAADYIKYLGDLKDLLVDATTSASLTLGAKRLESIKLGDEDPSKVTGNLQQLSVGDSPSIITIDCRNLTTLTGSLDLSKAPRLKYLYLGNTDVRTVIIANGARITTIQLPDSIQTINFNNLKYLETGNEDAMTGLIYSAEAIKNIEYLRVENCTSLNSYKLLKDCYKSGNSLKDIRVVNFTYDGTLEDFDILSQISKNKSYLGDTINYRGIDANGNIVTTLNPIIEGTINIDGAAYKDSVEAIRSYFYNMTLNINGGYYIRFADNYIKQILLNHGMGGDDEFAEDIHENKLKTITIAQLYDWFRSNAATDTSSSSVDPIYLASKNSTSFTELEEMTGVTELKYSGTQGVFTGYSSLKEVSIPRNCVMINNYTFANCAALEKVNMNSYLKTIGARAFENCPSLKEFTYPSTLTSIGQYAFGTSSTALSTNVEKLIIDMTPAQYINLSISSGGMSNLPYANMNNESFGIYWGNGTQITNFAIPENASIIKANAFQCWSGISFENINNNNVIQNIGASAFNYCDGLTGNINLPILNVVGNYSFQYSGISGFKAESLAAITQSCFEGCANLETVELKNLTKMDVSGIFRYCPNLKSVSLDKVAIMTGSEIFRGCSSLEEIILPSIQSGNSFGSSTFQDCTSLTKVTINSGDIINQVGLSSSMFKNCTSLQEIILPKGVIFQTNVSATFYGCTSLKNVYLPARSVTASTLFQYCSNLSTVKFNENLTYIYTSAFNTINKKGVTVDFSECTGTDPMVQYQGWLQPWVYRVIVPDNKYESWLNSSPNMLSAFAWRLMTKSEYDKQPVLNYVQFNGGQSYDTGIHGTGYMKFDLFMELGTSVSSQTWVFGQRTGFDQSKSSDTPDTYGLCVDGTFRLRAGQYSSGATDSQKFKYYPKTFTAPANGSTNISTVTNSSTLTFWPVSGAYGYSFKLKGGYDGCEGGYKETQYTLKGLLVKAFETHDPDYSNLTMWIGSVNNNGVTADANLSYASKIFYIKYYYTYYYIHTLYDTENDALIASSGLLNAEIHTTDSGKYYFTNYDQGVSDADYRIYTNKYITRELAEAAATGDYIITSNDEEVADFRPYKYLDDDNKTRVTFKNILNDYVCENYGAQDGIYGEY